MGSPTYLRSRLRPEWMHWTCKDLRVDFSGRPLVMGVVNATPDSFSDGGLAFRTEAAVARCLQLLEQGADILDVGGESTRPGAAPVGLDEELKRVVPVIEAVHAERPNALISVDTTKAEVGRHALAAGARILNDVSAGQLDAEMFTLAADSGAGLVLMHMQGVPRTMQDDPVYENVLREVIQFLRDRTDSYFAAGGDAAQICWDPGIGFGKLLDHNLTLLAGLPLIAEDGFPLLVGLSRKRMIGELTGNAVGDRMAGSLGGALWSVLNGAQILRVHDVKETCDACKVVHSIQQHQESLPSKLQS